MKRILRAGQQPQDLSLEHQLLGDGSLVLVHDGTRIVGCLRLSVPHT
jgi:hypothetical protein